jgi:hypothetical protein
MFLSRRTVIGLNSNLALIALVCCLAIFANAESSEQHSEDSKQSLRGRLRQLWYRNGYEYEYEYGSSTCFPSSATVNVKGYGPRTMDSLNLGDLVEVADGTFEPVYMFGGHRVVDVNTDMTMITTAGNRKLSLSPSHWLYHEIDGKQKAVRAADVVPGIAVYVTGGSTDKVIAASNGMRSGLFNPLTASGTIVVDGVVASTYATSTHPTYMHFLLSPIRLLSKLSPDSMKAANTFLKPVLGIDDVTTPLWLRIVDSFFAVVTAPKAATFAASALPICVAPLLK